MGMFIIFLCSVTVTCWVIKLRNAIIGYHCFDGKLDSRLVGHAALHFPLMADLNSQSDKLVSSWKVEASTRKAMWTKEVNSYGPIRAYVGPFCFMRRKTRTEIFAGIFYYTASLVITVKV